MSVVPRFVTELRGALDVFERQAARVEAIASAVVSALRQNHKVLTAGNGGSAAQALHLSEELIGRFARTRRPLAAVCLSSDVTALSCIANDFGYEEVFARQVEALGQPGDVLVVLTTSGTSANIIRALERARAAKRTTIGLLGPAGSAAERLCDHALILDREGPARIQELHLLTIHCILEDADAAFA
jgi:D-sedoheptulose 7-phosphate isomerase